MLKRARIVPLNEAEELDIRYWKEAVPEEKRGYASSPSAKCSIS